jgi:hypothetical protein
MLLWEVSCCQLPVSLKVLLGAVVSAAIITSGGCGTTVETPLPRLGPIGSSSLSQDQQKMAIQELNNKKATYEQDAIRHIEQSR